jgi:PKD repeat protein
MVRFSMGALAVLLAVSCGPPKTMTAVRKPEARFKYAQSSARPQVFTLDASDSFATVGSLAKYKWTFGDDSPAVETAMSSTPHAYKTVGTFVITLVVTDDNGTDSVPSTQQVSVTAVNVTGPKAALTGPAMSMLNMELTFDGSGSMPQGDLKNYAWNFADGTTTAGPEKKSVTHAFTSAGTYRVTLTVTDSLAQSDTAELQVSVGNLVPVAVCNWMPQPALQGVPVKFDGAGSTAPPNSTVATYLWDFGDGSPMGTGAMVSHTYNAQATFKPKLKVLDSQNRVSLETPCAEVVVGAPPLCAGEYTLVANPNQQSCAGSPTTWGGNKITIAQSTDGGMTATETFNMMPLVYSGSWAGSTFNLTGSYSQSTMGITIDTDANINGTFGGCTGWTGTWVEKQTIQGIGVLCTLTWNITSTRL